SPQNDGGEAVEPGNDHAGDAGINGAEGHALGGVGHQAENDQHIGHGGDKGVHFKLGRKESGDGGKHGAQNDTHHQGQKDPHQHRHGAEVEDVPEDAAGVGSLVHHDGGGGHAHAHHTADGQVGTGQQDQAGHAQSQEHSGGRLLEDVQDVVHRQQLGAALEDGGGNTKADEDDNDGDIQAVLQQEVTAVEGVLVVLPALGHRLSKGELGHAQHVDQVVLVIKGGMLAVLDLLEVLVQVHLRVKQAVLIDVLLVLDLLLVA